MNLVELLQIASSEEKAEEFLREKGVLKTFDSCPFCHAKNVGKIRRNFYKCYKCKKEWSVRKDSILEDLKIPLLFLQMMLFVVILLNSCFTSYATYYYSIGGLF